MTDLFRRLQLRYPSLHGGQYKDTNFLLECYMNETMLSDWRDDHPHCNKVNAADPKCYLCTPQGATRARCIVARSCPCRAIY